MSEVLFPFSVGQLKTASAGFVEWIDPARTPTKGVIAAGDVADPTHKQEIIAAGMGCKDALDAERWRASMEMGDPEEPMKSLWGDRVVRTSLRSSN